MSPGICHCPLTQQPGLSLNQVLIVVLNRSYLEAHHCHALEIKQLDIDRMDG